MIPLKVSYSSSLVSKDYFTDTYVVSVIVNKCPHHSQHAEITTNVKYE